MLDILSFFVVMKTDNKVVIFAIKAF